MISFMLRPTVRYLADILTGRETVARSSLVPIRPDGNRQPFFCVHPHDGKVLLYYDLARELDDEQPFYAFQAIEAVSGLTMTTACRHPGHRRQSHAQNSRSIGRSRGRPRARLCKTAN